MAAVFLRSLPEVQREVLPDGSTCIICQEEYGKPSENGVTEGAVRLPCPGQHIVGVEYIAKWLIKEGKNSCPCDRHAFFPAEPRPYLEYESFNGEHVDAARAQSSIGERATYYIRNLRLENLHRAAAVANLRTRHRREVALYEHLQSQSFQLPNLGNDPRALIGSGSPQVEAMFRELERRGAFHDIPGYYIQYDTNRETWESLRQRGYVYCPETLANDERPVGWIRS
ncbi:hypothetical protein MMC28_009167 [Mycoblastus sanguinarius]|nr:hypothetical protein [Mycoblastus sanguinarius]